MKQERMTSEVFRERYGSKARVRSTGSTPRGQMNRTEAVFASEVLEPLKLGKRIADYKYESYRLRLANGAWYTPDFDCYEPLGAMVFYEVKGFIREASLVRIKVAAEMYPHHKFIMVFRNKQIPGGWEYRNF